MENQIAILLNNINIILERKHNIEILIQLLSNEFIYGNLTIKLINKSITNNATNNTVFVDPAGSAFSGKYDIATWGGGGVSSVLYNYAEINGNKINGNKISSSLSEKNFEAVKNRTSAAYNKYNNCGIIHVVSFNFSGQFYNDSTIIQELTKSYTHVYNEYINLTDNTDFRMVVLSGAIFAGNYKDKILELTPKIIHDIFTKSTKPINISIYEIDKNSFNTLVKGFNKLK